jgi:hypothetical protein
LAQEVWLLHLSLAPVQKAGAEVRADPPEVPGRKLKVIVAGGHPGDPESAPPVGSDSFPRTHFVGKCP